MKQEILIANSKEFEEVKKRISDAGANKFHVVSDFDRTIIYGLTGERKKTATVISQLRSDPKYLGEEYQKGAHELFEVYHPIEVDPNVPLEEKKKKMHEWWKKHFDLISDSGLTKELIKQVVRERPLKFRRGSLEFISFLNENGVPLVFISAAPGDMLVGYLEANNLMLPNVYVISNRYSFDSNGRALKIQEPIIHTFNKTEFSLKNHPLFEKIKSRENVLLLGDSLGDIGMVEGFPYKNLIKVGFLNENVEENRGEYKNNFDVVITGDQDFDFVNGLVEGVLG